MYTVDLEVVANTTAYHNVLYLSSVNDSRLCHVTCGTDSVVYSESFL